MGDEGEIDEGAVQAWRTEFRSLKGCDRALSRSANLTFLSIEEWIESWENE